MNNRDQEKLVEKVAAGRLVYANEQVLFPLLNRKIDETVGAIVGEFQAHGTASLSLVATLTAYKNIVHELETVAREGERAYEVLDKNQQRRP